MLKSKSLPSLFAQFLFLKEKNILCIFKTFFVLLQIKPNDLYTNFMLIREIETAEKNTSSWKHKKKNVGGQN